MKMIGIVFLGMALATFILFLTGCCKVSGECSREEEERWAEKVKEKKNEKGPRFHYW